MDTLDGILKQKEDNNGNTGEIQIKAWNVANGNVPTMVPSSWQVCHGDVRCQQRGKLDEGYSRTRWTIFATFLYIWSIVRVTLLLGPLPAPREVGVGVLCQLKAIVASSCYNSEELWRETNPKAGRSFPEKWKNLRCIMVKRGMVLGSERSSFIFRLYHQLCALWPETALGVLFAKWGHRQRLCQGHCEDWR